MAENGTASMTIDALNALRGISAEALPYPLMPIGVRPPVVSMSMRALIGIVQALVTPGKRTTASIFATSSSQEIRSGQMGRNTGFRKSGAPDEDQRSFGVHCDGSFRTTVVSIIETGAGSVDVPARPALPQTRSTSGTLF